MRSFVTLHTRDGRNRRVLLLALPILAACLILRPVSANAQNIDFKADIPQAPAEMKVFKLTASKPPVAFVNEALRAGKLPLLAEQNKALVVRNTKFRDDPESVRAHIDPVSGDTALTPSMADLVAMPAGKLNADSAMSVARKAFGDQRFIPHDMTELRMGEPISVMGGATASARAPAANPKLTTAAAAGAKLTTAAASRVTMKVAPRMVMILVPAVRYAAGLPVVGRGSHAVVTVASDGSMAGALRRWRTASEGETVKTAITPEQVRADILRQLKGKVPDGSRAVIDKVELAYYDRNADFLQPVYRFEAEITPDSKKFSPIRLEGFVPIGQARETIPDLAAPPEGPAPMTADQKVASLDTVTPEMDAKFKARIGGAGTVDDFTLGEYANQDWPNDGGYVDMSYAFLHGLQASTSSVNRTQWYVAHNWEVVGPSSRYYMNAVNVAYTVPHGDWLINSTDRNCCEDWNVANIGTGGNPGFGHAAGGGVLATWIIMSCEVIPSMYDRQHEAGGTGNPYTAFDAWWGVFQGMHNAIGFRTIMYYPDDALNYGFGQDAAWGGDINSAWFQEVAAHEGGRGSYASQHLSGAPMVHYDRAATMVDARDLGHSIFHVTAQSASSTLWNFWMGN